MTSQVQYGHSAVVVSTIAWLLLATLFGTVAASEYLFELALPRWALLSSAVAAASSVLVATVVPAQMRCKLTVWFPLFWW